MDTLIAAPPADPASATLFVALELSRSMWLVALHSPLSDKVSQHRIEGGDVEGLLALIARKREQAQARLGRPIRVVSCFEAGYDGFWLHRWLCAHGMRTGCWTRPACWWIAEPSGPRRIVLMRPGSCAR